MVFLSAIQKHLDLLEVLEDISPLIQMASSAVTSESQVSTSCGLTCDRLSITQEVNALDLKKPVKHLKQVQLLSYSTQEIPNCKHISLKQIMANLS